VPKARDALICLFDYTVRSRVCRRYFSVYATIDEAGPNDEFTGRESVHIEHTVALARREASVGPPASQAGMRRAARRHSSSEPVTEMRVPYRECEKAEDDRQNNDVEHGISPCEVRSTPNAWATRR
jgi:hypothetical protein